MGSFIGTNKAFKRYIGPRLRNVVNTLTKEYRNQVGTCEFCSVTENLESAHVTGRDRTAIIDEILQEFTNGQIVTIDLEVFEEKFKKAHKPIQSVIKILCKECHRKYDLDQQSTVDAAINSVFVDIDTEGDIDEGKTISNREITDFIRHAVTTTLPIDEVNNLTSDDYSKQQFGVQYAVLKPVPRDASQEQIVQLAKDEKGYRRWSTRTTTDRNGSLYLVTTQWYERNRAPFVEWMKRYRNV